MTDEKKQIVTKEGSQLMVSLNVQKKASTRIRDHYTTTQLTIKMKKDESADLAGERDNQLNETSDLFDSLGADNTIKTMLVAQMAAVHDLQQETFLFAKGLPRLQERQSHMNTVAKLSHVFLQQAALLHKLQGNEQQKVIVEHVHIHPGAKAIVGNLDIGGRGNESKSQ